MDLATTVLLAGATTLTRHTVHTSQSPASFCRLSIEISRMARTAGCGWRPERSNTACSGPASGALAGSRTGGAEMALAAACANTERRLLAPRPRCSDLWLRMAAGTSLGAGKAGDAAAGTSVEAS